MIKRHRHLKTRAEIEAEYDRVIKIESPNMARELEKIAVKRCLQWVLWNHGTPPSYDLIPKPGHDDYKKA